MSPRSSIVAVLLLCAFAGGACTTFKKEPPLPPPPPPGTPLTPEPQEPADEEPLPVKKASEDRGRRLGRAEAAAARGRPGPDPGAAPEARGPPSRAWRCACEGPGALYSGGKVLVTDALGPTRDRLTTRHDRRPSPSTPGARATGSACPSGAPSRSATGAPARCRARPGPRRGPRAARVLSRPIDRLARSVDASIYRLIPQAWCARATSTRCGALFAYARRKRPPPDVPRRGHVALRPGGDRRHPGGAGAPFWNGARPGRGRARLGAARRRGRLPQPPARALRRRAGPRSRLHRRLHDRRHRRQQLLGDVLRRGPEQLPHAGRDRVHAGGRHRRRHRAARRGRPAAPGAARLCTRASSRCATRCARDAALAARIRRKFARKNTTGYSLNAFLDHDAPGGDPGPPDGRVAGHARLHGRA